MKFIDTNIFVRYLAGDDEKKSEACFRLFQRVQRGEEAVTTAEVIIAEVAYVLSSPSLYHLSHEEIVGRYVFAAGGINPQNGTNLINHMKVHNAVEYYKFETEIWRPLADQLRRRPSGWPRAS